MYEKPVLAKSYRIPTNMTVETITYINAAMMPREVDIRNGIKEYTWIYPGDSERLRVKNEYAEILRYISRYIEERKLTFQFLITRGLEMVAEDIKENGLRPERQSLNDLATMGLIMQLSEIRKWLKLKQIAERRNRNAR
jgi:hypothetical protein